MSGSYPNMKKASEYRQHAAECRSLASQMDVAEQREQLLAMAEQWDKMALDRASLIYAHPELAIRGEREEERLRAEPAAGLP